MKTNKFNNMDGLVTISRIESYRDEPRPIRISLKDENSRSEILEICFSYEEFSKALTGMSYQTVKFSAYNLDKLGKKKEGKHVAVPFVSKYYNNDAERFIIAKAQFTPFEVDGWEGRVDDYWNHHNRNSNNKTVNVYFERWV